MRLILVRHGESEWNRSSRYQGQADAPLSDLGIRQAEALGQRLALEKLDAIYASPLQRALRTAEAIARFHPHVPFTQDKALYEIHHGDWQGLLAKEVREQYPEGLDEWRMYPTRSQMPNGESFSNILKRTLNFRERMLQLHLNETVLVSTHDVVIKILIADALGMPMDRLNRIWVTNASISVLEYADALPFLVSLGEACHLGQLETVREKQESI
ncbi:MAG: histidine phosphatase family protein [Herpetosiphonaceae bacterium]|nr:histidine phosphatase family protein [Herpetosiphonaceae bacterium]